LGIPDSTVVVEPVSPGLSPWAAIFSSMFLHGGLLHLLGNMWFLWLFGPSVEDVLGRARFLAFYLLGGVAAAAAHVADDPTSLVPCVGASGAIAGVMGGYLVLFPRSEVLAVGPLILGGLIPLPAFIFLGFYLVEQIFMSMSARGGGVAWWAHIGGFVAGMIVVRSFRKTPEWEYALERRRPSGRRFGYDYPEARSEDGVGPFEDEDDPYRRRDDRLPTPRDFRR
jgi:membrane associated rhomboid family serine protease